MNEIIENFKKGWLDEDPRLVCATLLAIAVFVTLSILLGRHSKKLKKLKTSAIENNSVVKATLTYQHYSYNDNDDLPYSGRYTYTVNGKKKKYHINSDLPIPDTLDLYPKNKSKTKFFSDYDRTTNAAIPFNAIVSVAVLIFTLWVTGYISF